jgi:hypothetical protein
MTEQEVLARLATLFDPEIRTIQKIEEREVETIRSSFSTLQGLWVEEKKISKYGAYLLSQIDDYLGSKSSNPEIHESLLELFQEFALRAIYPPNHKISSDVMEILSTDSIMEQWGNLLPAIEDITTEGDAISIITFQLGEGPGLVNAILSWASLKNQPEAVSQAISVIHAALDILQDSWKYKKRISKLPTYYLVQIQDIIGSGYESYHYFPLLQMRLLSIANELHEHVLRVLK